MDTLHPWQARAKRGHPAATRVRRALMEECQHTARPDRLAHRTLVLIDYMPREGAIIFGDRSAILLSCAVLGDADTSPGIPPGSHKAAISPPFVFIRPGFRDHAKPWPSFSQSAAYLRNCAGVSMAISQLKSFRWEMAISVPLAAITPRLPEKWGGRTVPVDSRGHRDRFGHFP
jgi:hypothetical protein